MGMWIDYSNVISIGKETFSNGVIKVLGYRKLNKRTIQSIVDNDRIKYIQIDQNLPYIAFEKIDKILELRSDITFRIYSLVNEAYFDLNVLQKMPHLQKLKLEVHLVDNPKLIEPEKLCQLTKLKELSLDLYDLKDYSFIQNLNCDLESLQIMIDTKNKTPIFDCQWLLKFSHLHSLWLGKKAKKNIKVIGDMKSLRFVALRGIKVDNFYFLQDCQIEELKILWCGITDLSSLEVLQGLKYLELWRIPKLKDISIISHLTHLETLKLQDLSHIHELPDLTRLHHLKKVILVNMPLDESKIPQEVIPLIRYW